jgi:general secretion pathway protein J
MRNRKSGRKGFTLIELLVAISVLAIVAVLGWRGLDGIVRARVALNNDLEQTRGMQLAFAQLQSDSAHVAAPDDIAGRAPLLAEQGRITMVRTVFAENQPSRVQVVAYRVVEGVLVRRETMATRDLKELDNLWQAAVNDSDNSQAVRLQSDVDAMTIRTWSSVSKTWSVAGAAAPPAPQQNPAAAPQALKGLEVALQLRGQANNMVKVFLLGAI